MFSTRSNLVIVDVTVKDKAVKRSRTSGTQDFTVLEDGKPQKSLGLRIPETRHGSRAAASAKLWPTSSNCRKPPRPHHRGTRRAKIQYHDKRLLVFFFDFSSMGIPEQLRAQEAALEYLNKQITKDDMVAILLYTSTMQVLTDFTADRDVLTRHHPRLCLSAK